MAWIPRTEENYHKLILEAKTESGTVRGLPGGNRICSVFKGIPYAAAPVGELRWKKPQEAPHWDGVRECYKFGPASYQLDRSYEVRAKNLYPSSYEVSENCLYLNIWTPAQSTEDRLPVYFWTHGGGNFGGFGSELENDGEGLAKRDVILVTYNYRLNSLGFLAHPELSAESEDGVSGNYALYDAIAAFHWVRENIAAFGGDPDRITLGGQSAGCMMTMCLCASPLMKGKIAGATFFSGVSMETKGTGFFSKKTLKTAEEEGISYMKSHNCTSLAELKLLSPEELIRETDFEKKNMLAFRQIQDGVSLSKSFAEAAFAGELDDIPYICCCTADEQMGNSIPENARRQTATRDMELFCENQLSLGKKPAYAFRFSRPLPGEDGGAWHTSELFYLFETIQRTWRRMTGYDYELQTKMADYFANFIKTGDPNGDGLKKWEPYVENSRKVMDLGTMDGMISMR